ncbi:MAG: DUF5658 family protein [Promethearchaeota archaeon]
MIRSNINDKAQNSDHKGIYGDRDNKFIEIANNEYESLLSENKVLKNIISDHSLERLSVSLKIESNEIQNFEKSKAERNFTSNRDLRIKLKIVDYVLIISFILMRFLDIYSTYQVITHGIGEEANPIMKNLINNISVILLYNIILILLVIGAFYYFNYLNEIILLRIYQILIYTLIVIGFTMIFLNFQILI